jgi:hypothetical protein
MNNIPPSRFGLLKVCSIATAIFLAGCVSYSAGQLSAMPSVDLCELRETQGPNLSNETKQMMEAELRGRNDNCGNHAKILAERREAALYREMYGKHDDP